MQQKVSNLLAGLLWPACFGSAVAFVWLGTQVGDTGLPIDSMTLFILLAYFGLAIALFFLERLLPYRADWLQSDGQLLPDLGHTLLTKIGGKAIIWGLIAIGLIEAMQSVEGSSHWPQHWPMPLQVSFAMVLAEFGLYWAHRLAHTVDFLWRFHAVHHSVEKLWFFNTGRFHFVDTLVSIGLSVPLLILFGANGEVLAWTSAITAFIGFLTHCNIDMRCGIVNWVFNTPNLHRWHHSRKLEEGNKNFGENLVIWDLLFGTYYLPRDRQVQTIGIHEHMPQTFVGQLSAPFHWKRLQKKHGDPLEKAKED